MEFFYYLFSSSIRVEIRLNNVLQSPKKSLFSKWVKNANFFLYFDSVKIRLEIMLNNFVEKKENFSSKKNKIFVTLKKWHFSKGVNPCLRSKNAKFFFYLDLVKITLETMRNNFVQKEKNFFGIKTKCFKLLKMAFFPKVLTNVFGQNKTRNKI